MQKSAHSTEDHINTVRYAIAANLSENSHFQLERRPGLEYALEQSGGRAHWISIAEMHRLQREEGVGSAEAFLEQQLKNADAFLLHKELLFSITPAFLQNLSKRGVPVVGFIGDEEWDLQSCFDFVPLFDMAVVYSSKAVNHYARYLKSIYHLPVCASFSSDMELEKADQEIEDIDVLFIGRPYEPRPGLVKYLVEQGIAVTVYGSNEWERHLSSSNYRGFLSNENYNRTLARAKIVLGMMEAPNSNIPHINAKIFDAAKACKLSICTRYPPFETDYGLVEGESLVSYGSKEDLLAKIRFYLSNKSERDRIARNQAMLLRAKFDYKVQYAKLLAHVRLKVMAMSEDIAVASQPRLPMQQWSHPQWRPLQYRESVWLDRRLASILDGYSHLPGPVVIHSVYNDRIVIKRLPLIDAASVFVKVDAPKPPVIFGLIFCRRRWKTAYFPLNYYQKHSLSAGLIAGFYAVLTRVLELVRGHQSV